MPCWQFSGRKGGLPPAQAFIKSLQGVQTFRANRSSIGQFLISARDDHAHPSKMVYYLIDFHTHFRILAHPFDLLSDGGKAVEMVGFICEVNGNYVRLIVDGASESSKDTSSHHFLAFL